MCNMQFTEGIIYPCGGIIVHAQFHLHLSMNIKALGEQRGEIRVQFHDIPGDVFQGKCHRNELVIRMLPDEAMYLKIMMKQPGFSFEPIQGELDLTYRTHFKVLMGEQVLSGCTIDPL